MSSTSGAVIVRRIGLAAASAMTVLVVCALGALSALFALAAVNDWRVQAVLTSSMEPSISKGSLTVVSPIDPYDVEPGLSIAYRDPRDESRTVVHRAVAVEHYGTRLFFRTKGDANRHADVRPVPERNLMGVVRWNIPYVGRLLTSLGGPAAAALIGTPLLLFGLELAVRRRARGPSLVGAVPRALP